MKAVMVAAQNISMGVRDVVLAGGMESMTNAPYILRQMRGGKPDHVDAERITWFWPDWLSPLHISVSQALDTATSRLKTRCNSMA